MSSITTCPLPPDALLLAYRRDGAYTDCYAIDLPRRVSRARYVEAFCKTAVFRLVRRLLRWFAAKPSTNLHARQLAKGAIYSFAAWHVEARGANQLLLCDDAGSTRAWLMTVADVADAAIARLYFGSAVIPRRRTAADGATLGFVFRGLLGFHTLYSRVLLGAAARRLLRIDRETGAAGQSCA